MVWKDPEAAGSHTHTTHLMRGMRLEVNVQILGKPLRAEFENEARGGREGGGVISSGCSDSFES